MRQLLDAGKDDERIDAVARDQRIEDVEAADGPRRFAAAVEQRAVGEDQIDVGAGDEHVIARLQNSGDLVGGAAVEVLARLALDESTGGIW